MHVSCCTFVLLLETPVCSQFWWFTIFWGFRGGPKGVSTKGVSMKRPNFPYFRAFYTVVSKGNFQKSPWSWIPLLWRPFWSFPRFVCNFGWVFAILFEVLFNRNSRGNPSLCWLGRGGCFRGTKIMNKTFVNKVAFPICLGDTERVDGRGSNSLRTSALLKKPPPPFWRSGPPPVLLTKRLFLKKPPPLLKNPPSPLESIDPPSRPGSV